MPKLTIEDLKRIKEEAKVSTILREGGNRGKIIIHMGTCGIAAGARKILNVVMRELEEKKVKDIIVTTSSCAGLCSREPMATVEMLGKPPVKYVDLTEEKMRKIFEQHVLGGNIVSEYALAVGSEATF
ncbi:MAG: (2Fe-2S) ferredoxin domain-containing protein [candidate division KSB1 bacterium]|nr:(2Fe-2S) ferredoxin domain-containing protein [candidate division KSB1 bacterium]